MMWFRATISAVSFRLIKLIWEDSVTLIPKSSDLAPVEMTGSERYSLWRGPGPALPPTGVASSQGSFSLSRLLTLSGIEYKFTGLLSCSNSYLVERVLDQLVGLDLNSIRIGQRSSNSSLAHFYLVGAYCGL